MAAVISIDSVGDSQEADTAASPGTAKLRVTGNTLEASVNAGAYSPIITEATAALVTGGADALTPSITFTDTPTELLAFSTALTVAKTVLFTVQGTAYSTAVTTEFHFYVVVDGVSTAVRRFFFNAASSHQSWGGSWILEIPAGAVDIEVMGVRVEGSGTITLTADDFVCATFIG